MQSFKSVSHIHMGFLFCRIVGFLDNWPLLEEWFTEPQNILTKINAEIDEGSLCQKVKEFFANEIANKKIKGNYTCVCMHSLNSIHCVFIIFSFFPIFSQIHHHSDTQNNFLSSLFFLTQWIQLMLSVYSQICDHPLTWDRLTREYPIYIQIPTF